MNEMCFFLNSHQDIKKIVYVARNGMDFGGLQLFIRDANIRDLVLTGYLNGDEVERISNELKRAKFEGFISEYVHIHFVHLDDLKGFNEKWALCVCDLHPNAIISLSYLKPDYLLASIWDDRLSAFNIWEHYRDFSDFIQIKTCTLGKPEKILQWEKTDSDIEVSVILPTYNVEKYLDQCIASLIEWKAPYIEFLFINDGSPDGSREKILEWSIKDSRIKLIDKENGGCASARQLGLENAKGKYIGFIDPDDFIDGRMYKKLFKAAMLGGFDIAYCGYNNFYETTQTYERVEDILGEPYCDGTDNEERISNLVAHCRVAIWRGIYKAEMIKNANIHFYTDLRRFDDLPFKVETFAVAKSVVTVPEYLYYYRLARPGQDVSADDERLYVHFDIFKHLNDSIVSKGNQQLIDHLQICKIQTHLYALSKIKPQFKKYYMQKAKEDLLTTGDVNRTYKLAKERIGIENANQYKAIMTN